MLTTLRRSSTAWLALDVGGANLKAADGLGYAASRPFAVWRAPQRLAEELAALIAASPPCNAIAATMTAELADCYETKAVGVRAIIDSLESAAEKRPLSIYLTDGRLAQPAEARNAPQLAAASNWHALAAFANRFVRQQPALLVDMGSTTTDIIPLDAAGPMTVGMTDAERLVAGELVYTGIERTPVSAIVRRLPWRGSECPVASELFAVADDAYLILGDAPEEPDSLNTVDGRPRTSLAARSRLARMICGDADSFTAEDARRAATAICEEQLAAVAAAAKQVVTRLGANPQTLIISGQGEFLLRRLVERLAWPVAVLSLTEELGPAVSRCAPAHAVAVLARERLAVRTG